MRFVPFAAYEQKKKDRIRGLFFFMKIEIT